MIIGNLKNKKLIFIGGADFLRKFAFNKFLDTSGAEKEFEFKAKTDFDGYIKRL